MKKNTEISDRIQYVIDYLSINANAFAAALGYKRSQTIYDILNKKSAPSFDFFNRFQLSEYSERINTDWLITGRGDISKKPVQYTESGSSMNLLLNEHSAPYNSCPYCQEKDKIISVLQKELDIKNSTINKLIDVLHHKPQNENSNEYEQKRKAS